MFSALQPGRVIVQVSRESMIEIDSEPVPKFGVSIAGLPPVEKDSHGSIGLPLDQGKHKVHVSSPPFDSEFEVVDGRLDRIAGETPATPDEPKPIKTDPTPTQTDPPRQPAIVPPVVDSPAHPTSARRKIGWITIAGGAAVGVVGLYFGYDAISKQSDADDLCNTGKNCSDAAIALNDKAARSANVSNVLVGIGLVGAGIGTYLVLTAPHEIHVVPTTSGHSVGVSLVRGF
jgi:hypothetical protein